MADAEEIQLHTELIATYRRSIKFHLGQRAKLGALAPFSLEESLREAYMQIARSKERLRAIGETVDDEPDDTPSESIQSMLSPFYRRPQFETRGCSLAYSFWDSQQSEKHIRFELRAALFVTQPSDQTIFIPRHLFFYTIQPINLQFRHWQMELRLRASDQKNTSVSEGGIEIKGPALFELTHQVSTKMTPDIEGILGVPIMVELRFQLSNSEDEIFINVEMKYASRDGEKGQWRYNSHLFILW